jgi:sugar/nucleoside kinase (ribokinase family)
MYDIVVIGNPIFHNSGLNGPCIYSAATAAKIGFEQMALVSSIGPKLVDRFIQGVDALDIPEYFIIEANGPGAVELRNPSLNGELSILGVPNKITIRDIPEEFLKTQAILLSPSLQEISAELVEWICNSTDALVFLDPQLREVNSKGQVEFIRELSVTEKTQSYIDIIKPNQLESKLITGESDPFLAAELIVEWASETCIITLGENGCLVYDGTDFNKIPSYSIKEVDAQGAGDVFLAAFASQSIVGKTLTDCGIYASSIASLKVENQGLDFKINEPEIRRRSDIIRDSVEVR